MYQFLIKNILSLRNLFLLFFRLLFKHDYSLFIKIGITILSIALEVQDSLGCEARRKVLSARFRWIKQLQFFVKFSD